MGAIVQLLEKRAEGASLEDPNVSLGGTSLIELLGGGRMTATGKRVTEKSALGHSAVYAAINMIAGSIATLPLKVYRRRADGGRDEARDHHLWNTLHDEPNPEMSAASWKEAEQGHLLTFGNAYNEIVPTNEGRFQLWPLPPDKVEAKRARRGGLFYVVTVGLEQVPVPAERMLHVPGLGFDGVSGYGVIRLARESIALGLAADEYSARFYGNSSTPPGYLSSDPKLKEETARDLKQKWEEAQGGLDKAHRVAILHGGIKWESIGLSQKDAEFLESRKFQVREIARWFNLPPHKIRDLDNATFTNIEQQNIEFVVDSLRPWLVRWEQAIARKLLSPEERMAGMYVEFNVEGLLRGDTEKRGAWYRERFNTGSMTPNEIRAKESANPIPGGDRAFIQINMIPLDQADALSTQERVALMLADKGVPAAEPRAHPPEARASLPAFRLRLREAFRGLFVDASRRTVNGEIRNVRRASERLLKDDDPAAFMTWLSEYYFEEHPAFMRGVLEPVFVGYADAMVQAAAEEVNAERLSEILVRAFVGGYLDRAINSYAASSRKQLEDVIRTSRDAEDAIPSEALDQRLGEWDEGAGNSRPRSERFSARHTVEMAEAATRHAWESAGVIAITSVAIGDSCPYCKALDGRTIGIREAFIRKGEAFQPEGASAPLTTRTDLRHPPYHGGCNCTTRAS